MGGAEVADFSARRSGGGGKIEKNGSDNGKAGVIKAKIWVIRGYQASHDFLGAANAQCAPDANNYPRNAADNKWNYYEQEAYL